MRVVAGLLRFVRQPPHKSAMWINHGQLSPYTSGADSRDKRGICHNLEYRSFSGSPFFPTRTQNTGWTEAGSRRNRATWCRPCAGWATEGSSRVRLRLPAAAVLRRESSPRWCHNSEVVRRAGAGCGLSPTSGIAGRVSGCGSQSVLAVSSPRCSRGARRCGGKSDRRKWLASRCSARPGHSWPKVRTSPDRAEKRW